MGCVTFFVVWGICICLGGVFGFMLGWPVAMVVGGFVEALKDGF